MPTPTPVTEAEARHFLEDRLGRTVDPVEWVGEGAWSRCFGFRDGGRELVVRFGAFAVDFEKDRRAASLRSPTLPIPEVIEVGPAFDGYFAISSRVRGVPLESLSRDAWRGTLPSLLSTLDAIRRADLAGSSGWGEWDGAGQAPFASWRDFLLDVERDTPEQRTHGWRRRLRQSAVGEDTFRAGLSHLDALSEGLKVPRSLVHCDLINRNVLVESDTITGVFDWGCSLYGDFLYDLAWIEFWAPWHEGIDADVLHDGALAHYAEAGLALPDSGVRLHCCKIHIALAHQAYNAFTGDAAALQQVTEHLEMLLP